MKNYLVLLGCMVTSICFAQQQKSFSKYRFQTRYSIGLFNGSLSSDFNMQAIAGFSMGKYFLGAGAAVDYYRYRSIPLFIDVRRDFGVGSNRLFVYGDVGHNIPRPTIKKNRTFIQGSYSGGAFLDGGVGFKHLWSNKTALLVSGGCSYKLVKITSPAPVCPVQGPCFNNRDVYAYNMYGLILRLGWQF